MRRLPPLLLSCKRAVSLTTGNLASRRKSRHERYVATAYTVFVHIGSNRQWGTNRRWLYIVGRKNEIASTSKSSRSVDIPSFKDLVIICSTLLAMTSFVSVLSFYCKFMFLEPNNLDGTVVIPKVDSTWPLLKNVHLKCRWNHPFFEVLSTTMDQQSYWKANLQTKSRHTIRCHR